MVITGISAAKLKGKRKKDMSANFYYKYLIYYGAYMGLLMRSLRYLLISEQASKQDFPLDGYKVDSGTAEK